MSLHLAKCHIVRNHTFVIVLFSLGDKGYSGSMIKVFPSKSYLVAKNIFTMQFTRKL